MVSIIAIILVYHFVSKFCDQNRRFYVMYMYIMCDNLKKLPQNLRFVVRSGQMFVFDGQDDIALHYKLISNDTGSGAFVYKIYCQGQNGLFPVVAKIQTSRDQKKLTSLQYEKKMYDVMTKLVDSRICPFRLRRYDMKEPSQVLLTETFENMVSLARFMDNHLVRTNHINHKYDCYNLLVQLLYAIEINFRIGLRHNDLHECNIMVQLCTPRENHLLYLTRDKTTETLITMQRCSFLIKMFDNDRTTKLQPKNNKIVSNYQQYVNSSPVTNLWPFYEPSVYSNKFDLFNIMQYVRNNVKSRYMKSILEPLNVSLKQSELIAQATRYNNVRKGKQLLKYHLVKNERKNREPAFVPSWLDKMNSTEKALLQLTKGGKSTPKTRTNLVGNMKKLYAAKKTRRDRQTDDN